MHFFRALLKMCYFKPRINDNGQFHHLTFNIIIICKCQHKIPSSFWGNNVLTSTKFPLDFKNRGSFKPQHFANFFRNVWSSGPSLIQGVKPFKQSDDIFLFFRRNIFFVLTRWHLANDSNLIA